MTTYCRVLRRLQAYLGIFPATPTALTAAFHLGVLVTLRYPEWGQAFNIAAAAECSANGGEGLTALVMDRIPDALVRAIPLEVQS